MATAVKQEQVYAPPSETEDVIDLCDSEEEAERPVKRRREEEEGEVVLPLGFLDPLPREEVESPEPIAVVKPGVVGLKRCRQFWKAGDFDEDAAVELGSVSVGMDHVRVHPKFLHSNATSHKWALGAFAELLDNALDEVCHGATFVNIDVLDNKKDGTKMILVEDNGGGMDPDRMRQCMSLGYSAKSKMANTIGQYGNGFKTSTMRLGADVIVFSRCLGKDGKSPTQSIGMLSYTFLRNTGKEDIVVPMLDYEKGDSHWNRMSRMTLVDWNKNLETVLQWSPYSSEAELLGQFRSISDQGTRIVIYNIWEDDQGELELDFNADKQDIQLRGVNRDEKKIKMAVQFQNLRHFLTYQHSLRSYASILYLRLPPNFRIILRGAEIEHHNIANDMIMKQEITYRPLHSDSNRIVKDTDLVAVVTIGFVKDAKDHVDVQGFNVYHKNRLIKPFWRLWNAAGSDGRGVIGVLEANFVEPAHDKQGFERTTVLSRLETRLIQMQKQYWRSNCHKIGYAPRQNGKITNGLQDGDRDSSPEDVRNPPSSWPNNSIGDAYSRKVASVCKPIDSPKLQSSDRHNLYAKGKSSGKSHYLNPTSHKTGVPNYTNGHLSPFTENDNGRNTKNRSAKYGSTNFSSRSDSDSDSEYTIDASGLRPGGLRQGLCQKTKALDDCTPDAGGIKNLSLLSFKKLKEENYELSKKLKEMEESMSTKLQFERDRNSLLSEKLEVAERKLEEMNKEQEALIDIFSEERLRRDKEEEALRKKLKDASTMIQELREKAENRNGVNKEG